ncbi:hypothetical protein P3T37_004440 [Kitasatospora sp. MAA4]|nr:hypothetical protein [Kitasatospora sp. MAA4]
MVRPSDTRRSIYVPQVGEVVQDLARKGQLGVYMGTQDGLRYLRPKGGGVEWTTEPEELAPEGAAPQLEPVSRPSAQRDPRAIQLPDVA